MQFSTGEVGYQSLAVFKNSTTEGGSQRLHGVSGPSGRFRLRSFGRARGVIEPENRGNGLGVLNGAAKNHADDGGQGDEAHRDDFIVFWLRGTLFQAGSHVDGHGLGDEARAGKKLQDATPVAGGISGFFQQFALGGRELLLAGIDAAGGQFP